MISGPRKMPTNPPQNVLFDDRQDAERSSRVASSDCKKDPADNDKAQTKLHEPWPNSDEVLLSRNLEPPERGDRPTVRIESSFPSLGKVTR